MASNDLIDEDDMANSDDQGHASNDQSLGGDETATKPISMPTLGQHSSKRADEDQAQSTSSKQDQHADETMNHQGQSKDGAATAQGADDDDDNVGQQKVAQPTENPAEPSVDHQDQNTSASRSTRKAHPPDAKAKLDGTANFTQQGEASYDSSSSSPLRDALNKAETAIFDAYKDLVALKTSASNHGERDEFLTSALNSAEKAMKNILVAQAAAGASAQTPKEIARAHQERGAGEPALGVLPPTTQSSQPRDEAAVAPLEARREEQATQSLPPPAGTIAARSPSTSEPSEFLDTAKSTARDAQAAAPEQPTKSYPDGWAELHPNLNETLSDLL